MWLHSPPIVTSENHFISIVGAFFFFFFSMSCLTIAHVYIVGNITILLKIYYYIIWNLYYYIIIFTSINCSGISYKCYIQIFGCFKVANVVVPRTVFFSPPPLPKALNPKPWKRNWPLSTVRGVRSQSGVVCSTYCSKPPHCSSCGLLWQLLLNLWGSDRSWWRDDGRSIIISIRARL